MISPSDALKKWDEEEQAEKKPTMDEQVKAAMKKRENRWKAEDRPFVKKLIKKSVEVAAEANRKGEDSIKDIFLGQAARLEEELKELESLYGPYVEPKEPAPAKKRAKKARRRKR